MMLPEFPDFAPVESDGKYLIRWAGESYTFYTSRSGPRDLAAFKDAIRQVRPGHTALVVAPYADGLAGLFQSSSDFIFLSPFSFSSQLPADGRFVGDTHALDLLINSIDDQQKFAIHIAPQWRLAGPAVAEVTRKILERAAVRLKTIRHFGRLWPVNFRLNAPNIPGYGDITELRDPGPPDALVMAGPSLDQAMSQLNKRQKIWAADTAVVPLIARGIIPRVVFSADAGFASREHFVGAEKQIREVILVCDLLGSPAVQRLAFGRVLTYASSHPLIQEFSGADRFTAVANPHGDVGSLMQAVHRLLFGAPAGQVLGHDGRQRRKITHARGTAYFYRSHAAQNRLSNVETYMLRLSRRYA